MKTTIVAGLLAAQVAAGARLSARAPSCTATKDFTGWSSIKYAFIFYTSTGFNYTLTAPSPSNPFGNPPFPGWTSSNGPNWVGFLTTKYNASLLLTYNLAYGGATVDSDLVAPYMPTVLSLSQQVRTEFTPTYVPPGSKAASPPWTSANSLFAIWIGINDVGNSYYRGTNVTETLYAEIFDIYSALVDELYAGGARNFVFLNVPPVERSPLAISQGKEAQENERLAIVAFNGLIEKMAAELKDTYKEVNVWVHDTYTVFGEVLDAPAAYNQTEGYKNTTAYCEAYQNGTPEWSTLNTTCGVAVDEYFWLNSLHPTYPMHDVVAEGVAKALEAGPNVCPKS